MKNRIINVQDVPISISQQELDDYICITDIAKAKTGESRSADVVKNWLRNRNTLEFLGTWEMIYNPDFKVVEFDHFKSEAGLHTFVLSVAEWINKTNAIGLYVKRGKYGGTYAHKDIAFEFASAIPRCVSQIFLSTKATRHAVKLHIHPTAIQIPSIPQIRFFVPILFLNRFHNFRISMYLLQSLKHLN